LPREAIVAKRCLRAVNFADFLSAAVPGVLRNVDRGDQRQEIRGRRSETGDQRQEIRDRRSDTRDYEIGARFLLSSSIFDVWIL
jgi:hypothetical protein